MAQREKSAVAVAVAAPSSSSSSSAAPSAGGVGAAAVPSGERWGAAIGNLRELGANVESLQKLLARKAVFVDDDVFSKASLAADQARTIKILDQRVQSLERELDAAISAASRARTEKRHSGPPNYVHRKSLRSWKTLQECSSCTWKSCGQNKRRLLREIVISKCWKQ